LAPPLFVLDILVKNVAATSKVHCVNFALTSTKENAYSSLSSIKLVPNECADGFRSHLCRLRKVSSFISRQVTTIFISREEKTSMSYTTTQI